ncbi:formimidoylglutamate deiminase [Sphingomonas sp. ZB1N12]|uniref:formimidoylglutamate deiminase n=1 Tax=Sphingomonas arabinosi TaxID=3096160 RepID=UPI002FCB4917
MTTLWFETALLPQGWAKAVRIAIGEDGRIASVDADTPYQEVDERHWAAMPGVPNLHSHAFQRAMAGLTERRGSTRDSFWTWRDLMYRFAARIDPDLLEAVAAMAFVEMLESGFTRTGEFHYVHHQPSGSAYDDVGAMAASLASAADLTGIGLTVLPVFYAASGFGGQAPTTGQRRFLSSVDGFAKLLDATETAVATLPDAIIGIAPHSLRAVPPDALQALAQMRPNAPFHLHIAEQVREVEDCVAWSGRRPVEWLFDTFAVDARWCLVHATHVSAAEVEAIVASRAVVGLCPVTEANLGDGIFPANAFAAQGGRYGVGSDSNVAIDAGGELRMLEYGQRLVSRERNVLAASSRSSGRAMIDAAIAGGAQALGMPVAGLVAGTSADLVSFDGEHPSLAGRNGDAILDSWVFAAGQGAIDCVWRRGQRLVSEGRHFAREQVAQRYKHALGLLLDGQ